MSNFILPVSKKLVVLCLAIFPLIACSETENKKDMAGVESKIKKILSSDEVLPYLIYFKANGAAEIVDFGDTGESARIKDVSDEEFPIAGKIKRIETVTMVTYEASCDVLIKTSSGYKKVVIHNEAVCAAIQP